MSAPCPECLGLGNIYVFPPNTLTPDEIVTLSEFCNVKEHPTIPAGVGFEITCPVCDPHGVFRL